MAEWLANLTAFRDVLLLLVNLGTLVALLAVVGLLVVRQRRSQTSERQLHERLDEILAAQMQSASAKPLADFKKARTAPAPPAENEAADTLRHLTDLLTDWLERSREHNERVVKEIRDSAQSRFPTAEFSQLVERHRESIRQLLTDWGKENSRRTRANDQLRDAIREDIRAQTARLKQLMDESPAKPTPQVSATQTSGTITASATDEHDEAWREEIQSELRQIVDRLDRMSERMDEIFSI